MSQACVPMRKLSNRDSLWQAACLHRWAGKQRMGTGLFHHANYRELQLTSAECDGILAGHGVGKELDELHEKRAAVTELTCGLEALPILGKWKTSYAHAEVDSKRNQITMLEMDYFRWALLYHGQPSRHGLRHFRIDGQFESPYLGSSSWSLDEDGWFVLDSNLKLPISRTDDWGWMLGEGCQTEYSSVDLNMKVPTPDYVVAI
eukprot:TRINITY_DN23129_c0_g1_i1.p1 TRINITY_DN23129_c0_g1~~TRINITY_DN23129_c0_g1_i1.p1  ORF type:complete len:204 (+),score=30.08 TRINITY_DN23129_c0_g1_i1:180-791(+)